MKRKFLIIIALCVAIGLLAQLPGDALSQEVTGTPQALPASTLPPPPNSRPTIAPPPPTSLPPTMPQPTALPSTMPPPNPRPDGFPSLTPTYAVNPVPTSSPVLSPDGWTTYADTDPALIYAKGTWQTLTIPEAMGGTVTFTTDPHTYLRVYFEGTGIRVIHSAGPDGNAFTAKLDNQPQQTGSAYFTEASYWHQFAFENLTPGFHELTIVNGPGTLQIEGVQVQGNLIAVPPLPSVPGPTLLNPDTQVAGSTAVRTISYTDGPYFLNKSDETGVGPVNIGFSIDFFGTLHSELYIDVNGFVTFDADYAAMCCQWYPIPLHQADFRIITPFWADIDTSDGTGNTSTNVVEWGRGTIGGNPAFVVTWREVGCFSDHFHVKNTFQVVLTQQPGAVGNHILEFNYDQIEWEAGDNSGGDANCIIDLNADPIRPPRAGFSEGQDNPANTFELSGSGDIHAFLDIDPTTSQPNPTGLIHNSLDSSVLGRYRWCFGGPCPPEPCIAYPAQNNPHPPISQEALDMIAIATDAGILYHAGPTINAQRDVGYRLDWGDTTGREIQYRLVFTDDPHSITWYGFNDSTFDGGISWFVGSMTDDTPTGLQTYEYVEQLTGDCGTILETPEEITFPYNRAAAVHQGIVQTNHQNDMTMNEDLLDLDPPNQHSRVTVHIPGLPYADFNYYPHLTHKPQLTGPNGEILRQGSTGSAPFISEMLWYGGMPMSIRNEACDPNAPPDYYTYHGWRYCPDVNWVSANWRSHQGIHTYYAPPPPPISTDPTLLEAPSGQIGQIVCHEDCLIRPCDECQIAATREFLSLNDFVYISEGYLPNNNPDLSDFSDWINAAKLDMLSAGDYIFLNIGGGNDHGVLVAGWGELQDCEDALGTTYTTSNLSFTIDIANDKIVPYIVDFAGLPEDGESKRIQRTKPRPFYCTRFYDDEGGLGAFGGQHGWMLYQMPAAVTLLTTPENRIYVSLTWSWE